jgi:putative DNA-invertase from lambdoid prophage Rac
MKKRSKTRVIGYLRVSTEQQDLENQRYGILKLANRNKWQVDFVEEKVSGKVPVEERELGKVIKTLKQDDVLIVTELSRLGRSMIEIMTLLGRLLEIGVKVFALKGEYKLDGSMQSRIMTMVLCMASEIEKELLSQRVKEALQRKKQEGVKLGRPKGVPGKSKLDGKDNEIKLLLDKKVSISSLAKIHDCSWPTMKNFIDKKILT